MEFHVLENVFVWTEFVMTELVGQVIVIVVPEILLDWLVHVRARVLQQTEIVVLEYQELEHARVVFQAIILKIVI